ncbi:Cu2+-exporting ATPase [Wickerhamomyces ciferrii]|uniref:Cu2+-exporting ATPase n=1 Tax=Wickerhamomyces ciferrii (strain ATCC 14091 / BCRC 22168 / CBS 111 / JCM 3599 / NBRC 0793 / NRRL Y-1031 F-60-10) TaxID=1206466 RepID=K0KK61_WICCF|nr:Cu2+-exporting ATPase [Wickerhamomyces ciferrii]CCH43306.1 Cu2+-exporting ATPase [Wickerhamomyces ciferrii]
MEVFNVTVANIHCEDCKQSIIKALSEYFQITEHITEINASKDKLIATVKVIDDTELTILTNKGILNPKLQKTILNDIEDLGFVIKDYLLHDVLETQALHTKYKNHKALLGKIIPWIGNKGSKAHLEHCAKCRDEKLTAFSSSSSSSDDDDKSELTKVVAMNPLEYRAVFTIGGMTCSACAQTVCEAIKESLVKSPGLIQNNNNNDQDDGDKFSVDPVTNTAIAIIPNKQIANTIINNIRDSGYSATLVELLPVERETKYRVSAAIGGITCAACASSITNSVSNLSFVVESAISVVSKSGVFILDSDEQAKIDELQESIENCGFDFELVDIKSINHATTKKQSRTINLKISGMFCEHCPEEINEILNKHGNAITIEDPITLNHPFVKFTYIPSPPSLTIRSVLEQIKNAGNFEVEIIEAISLDEHLRRIARLETIKIAYRLILTTILAIPTFVFGIVGMSLLPKSNGFRQWLDKPLWVGNVSRMTWVLFFLSTPVYFFAADIFHLKAMKEIRTLWKKHVPWKRRLFRFGSMNLLMCLGTSVAYFASIALLGLAAHSQKMGHAFTTTYFDSVVFLTFFLLIGRLLESFSKSKTAEAITKLGSLKSNSATLLTKKNENEYGDDLKTDLKLLEVGDFIRIVPGESPPVDCIIVQGKTDFDESALTGESVPVEHTVGEQVFAGTVNKGPQSIIAKLSALDGTSLLDQIVNTVRDGQMRRAPIERTADILTGYFVPVITALAIITWIIWLSLGYSGALPDSYLDIDLGGWAVWSLEFAISVFVIACPCGIGLAAPTALFVGAGLAAKNGILARGGGSAFQEGSKVNVVCFDKTGTLTMGGEPKVTNFAIHQDKSIKEFAMQMAKDLEVSSSHPLAIAVKNFIDDISYKKKINIGRVKVPEVEEIPGKGLKGDVIIDDDEDNDSNWKNLQPTKVLLGNETLMIENKVQFTSQQKRLLNEWKIQGKSVIIVSIQCLNFFKTENFIPILLMGARDEIRPEAKNVILQLKKEGITTWMISGDNSITANAIAKELGIDNVVAEVLPEEKAEKIKWIKRTNYIKNKEPTIAMVGDGINDAPALSTADVGIALASGSDLALTSSDFVLLAPKHPLIALLTLFKLSRTVFNRVRFNFGWALIYNMIGVPISAGVIYPYNNSRLSPVWASAAMAASSISVVLSSLALKFFRKPKVVTEQSKTLGDIEAIEEKF